MPFICSASVEGFYRDIKHSIKCLLGINTRKQIKLI